MKHFENVSSRFDQLVWQPDIDRMRGIRRWIYMSVRVGLTLIESFRNGEITLRAMSLVYTTLVSLVPLLALAFALLKAFGVDNALRPALERFLAPLGSGKEEIINKILDFVSHVQVGVLGAIGVVVLIYSVLSLIQKVESGCNFIWHIHHPRKLGYRVSGYLSVLFAGPLVIFAAASLTASMTTNSTVAWVTSIEPFGTTLYLAGKLLPYVLYSVAFMLLFKFLPNTRVRWLPALGGGIFSGVLWQTASLGFTLFAKNAGNVNAIYSSFAIIILLLIWLYISWMILLLGCRVAYLLQHTESLVPGEYPPRIGAAEKERIALLIAVQIADRFIHGQDPWTVPELAMSLRAAPPHVHEISNNMIDAGILVRNSEFDLTLLPRKDIAEVRLGAILASVRTSDVKSHAKPRNVEADRVTRDFIDRLSTAANTVCGHMSLRELTMQQYNDDTRKP